MTKRTIREIGELEVVAERAGGYVADPRSAKRNLQKEQEFTIVRQYCTTKEIPMRLLTDKDYQEMGIER